MFLQVGGTTQHIVLIFCLVFLQVGGNTQHIVLIFVRVFASRRHHTAYSAHSLVASAIWIAIHMAVDCHAY